ncbi:MAG: lipid-A-disaccharide synthase [Nitrospirota bacterium]
MKKILIIAGEASGDLHGASLVKALQEQSSDLKIYGVGSRKMREAGVTMLADASEISVVGATEVLTHIGAIYGVYAKLKRFLREERPDLLVLIDFPDFNILTGKAARKLGIPVLYYISPQVWAWRKGRVKTIAKLVEVILVVFPFEVELYQRAGVDVRFVGHPLADVVGSPYTRDEARKRVGLAQDRRTIALLPGSRRKEIAHLLPDMLKAARLLRERFTDVQFALPVAPTLDRDLVEGYIKDGGVPVTIVDGRVYDVLRASDAAVVTSGTATLETGLMAVPMVIIYRVSRLSYWIGRMIVDVKNIGLVNIVAGRTVVPELVQDDVTPERIAQEIGDILADSARLDQMRRDLKQVRTILGEGGASRRAAEAVLELLGRPAERHYGNL